VHYAPFFVTGTELVYQIGPFERSTDTGVVEEPAPDAVPTVIGVEVVPERREIALENGLVDVAFDGGDGRLRHRWRPAAGPTWRSAM